MSKLTQGHIDCLVNWMTKNPGKKLNVNGTWRNNGYEVLGGYGTKARNKVYGILESQGYEIDKINACLVRRKLDESDLKITAEEKPIKPKVKAENTLTKKGAEMIEKSIESMQKNLVYTTDLTPESVQSIAKSLQGMAYTAQLMSKGATVTISVEMGGVRDE